MEGALPPQASHRHSIDQSVTANRFTESCTPTLSGQTAVQGMSASANAESEKIDTIESEKRYNNARSVKSQFSNKSLPTQQGNTTGRYYQRGHKSQRNNTGNELPHRRMGFYGRGGVDRNLPAVRMKQIYVAKQTTTGNPST
ncbi:uncharacterized protein LOC121805757 [Salvia splendens]|nr:uncharacterized protein LOC121805757 [Salvia splendens]